MSKTKEIKHCEVCGNQNLPTVLDLGDHPMCDDLIPIGDERICTTYPIEILFCATCATAHQRYQVPKHNLFPKTYHYRSRFTKDVLDGMEDLVAATEQQLGSLQNKKVLDIGCNDGSLLQFFKQKGAQTFGIEPTDAYIDAEQRGHTVFNQFLSKAVAEQIVQQHGKPDVITFTNVFAHIEDLTAVIEALKVFISQNSLLVIENHYLGAVLKYNQFDTFYHEHPRSYSYTSFVHIAKNLGLALQAVAFPARYGGNIRVFIGNSNNAIKHAEHEKIQAEEKNFATAFQLLRNNIKRWQANKGAFIHSLKQSATRWHGKAFPGRAAILIKLLAIDESIIEAVFEKPGSMKIGHYIPGTRIPILSDDTLFADANNKPLLNFAWHISKEIRQYLTQHGFQGQLVDVLSQEDFVS